MSCTTTLERHIPKLHLYLKPEAGTNFGVRLHVHICIQSTLRVGTSYTGQGDTPVKQGPPAPGSDWHQ